LVFDVRNRPCLATLSEHTSAPRPRVDINRFHYSADRTANWNNWWYETKWMVPPESESEGSPIPRLLCSHQLEL